MPTQFRRRFPGLQFSGATTRAPLQEALHEAVDVCLKADKLEGRYHCWKMASGDMIKL